MTFIAVMSLAGATGARAYDFVYGGIYFDVLSAADRTCALAQGDSDYEGRLDIPDTVYFSSGSGQPVPFTVKLINSVYGESGTSGLNGSNGLAMGVAVKADMTISIQELKLGHFLNDGKDFCGRIVNRDIGIAVFEEEFARRLEQKDMAAFFPKRRENTHKGSYGRAAVAGGSRD